MVDVAQHGDHWRPRLQLPGIGVSLELVPVQHPLYGGRDLGFRVGNLNLKLLRHQPGCAGVDALVDGGQNLVLHEHLGDLGGRDSESVCERLDGEVDGQSRLLDLSDERILLRLGLPV